MSSYLSIPIDQISPSKHQARKEFDEEAIKGLAESMKLEGLLQPVTVRKVGEGYELISGERRLRAAKFLGWPAIEAKVIETASEGEAAAKGLIENLQREDLNPIEEAEGFQELIQIDNDYWTREKIGSVCGKGKTYISESLSLLGLPEGVKQKVRTCELSRSHAELLLRLPTANQQETLAKAIENNGWSVRETERKVSEALNKPPTKAAKPATPVAPDPFASLWIDLLQNPGIPLGNWKAKYEGSFTWTFRVTTPQVDLATGPSGLHAVLGNWFRAMAEAMGQTQEAEARSQKVRGSLVPSSKAEFKQAEAEQANLRLPQTPEDWAEVEARAAKGPSEVYAWIYGETSFMANQVKGLTWADMGQSDAGAVAACHQLIEGLRQMQEVTAEHEGA